MSLYEGSPTISVFGASGKLGQRVLEVFERRQFPVRALVHKTPITGWEHVTSISGDITDPAAVREVVKDSITVVQMATTKEDPDTFFDVSIRGTFNVLEACRRNGKLKSFLLISGDAAYGIWFYPQPKPITEEHALTAYPGYYAFSKVIEETMTQQYGIQYGLPYLILRCSWVFEKDDLLNHFSLLKNVNPAEPGHGFGDITPEVLDLVKRGEERIPILLDADGRPLRRHIVHADDVAHAVFRVWGNPNVGQSDATRIFNIAGPAPFDYRTAANYISKRLGIPTIELRCPHYHSFEIDTTRARETFGYKPFWTFEKMVEDAIEWRAEQAT